MKTTNINLWHIITNIFQEETSIYMPSFNRGIFKNVVFDTRPIGRFREPLSYLRIYPPYFPGNDIRFNLSLTSLHGRDGGFLIQRFENGKNPQHVINIAYGPQKETVKMPLVNLPGYGTLDYRMQLFDNDDYVTLVSVKATHNEVLMSIAATGVISLTCVIVAWLLGLIKLVPFWEVWIP